MTPSSEALGQLRWRCRRGMKELDVLLAHYVDTEFCAAPLQEQQAFMRLLEVQDPVLYGYFVAQRPPPADLAQIVQRVVTRRWPSECSS